MIDMKKAYLVVAVACFIFLVTKAGMATTITYTAINLTDISPGEDLWQYSYQVSDGTFSENTGFTIYFEYNLYDSIMPVSAPANWDITKLDPDPNIPDQLHF